MMMMTLVVGLPFATLGGDEPDDQRPTCSSRLSLHCRVLQPGCHHHHLCHHRRHHQKQQQQQLHHNTQVSLATGSSILGHNLPGRENQQSWQFQVDYLVHDDKGRFPPKKTLRIWGSPPPPLLRKKVFGTFPNETA